MKRLQKVKEFTKEHKWQLLAAGVGLGVVTVGIYKLNGTARNIELGDFKLPERRTEDGYKDESLIDELVNNWIDEDFKWVSGISGDVEWILAEKGTGKSIIEELIETIQD